MRQSLLELWIENKKFPIILAVKISLLILSVGSGALLRGYPYAILALVAAMSLQSVSVKLAAQVEFLIPRSDQDRKRNQIQKSIWVAGVYTLANTVGYVLIISFCEPYGWDTEMIIFIIMIALFVFLLIFNFRMFFERIRYFEFQYERNKIALYNTAGKISFEVITPVLSIFCVFLFLLYKFAKLEQFLFLGTGYWRMLSLAVIGAAFVLLCISTWKHCRNIVVHDYYG